MLHSHHLVTVLYLLLLAFKLVLLFAGNKERLATVNSRTKIPRIVLEALMLATGLYLVFRSPLGAEAEYMVKYGALAAGIALGVVAFKRYNKVLGAICLLLFVYVYGMSRLHDPMLRPLSARISQAVTQTGAEAAPLAKGEALYSAACARCHGEDGKGNFRWKKALKEQHKNLLESPVRMSKESIKSIVANGRNAMPAFNEDLSPEQIEAVAEYVQAMK